MAKYVLNGKTVTREEWLAGAPGITPGCPPACMTDNVFLEGHANGNQFAGTPKIGDHYKKVAEAHGQNVKGKVYLAGLAAFPGDPRAWVSGRGDVQKVCEERGWNCTGAVKCTPAEVAPPMPSVHLADDIVQNEVNEIIAAEPEAESQREEITEKVRKVRKPHWSPSE